MIDKSCVQREFELYTGLFDSSNLMISNKKSHTYHVAENCVWIAKHLGLDEECENIAWLVGMLHDIGRFEQVKRINGYTDEMLDHAEIGVRLLFDEGMIEKFIDNKAQFETIKKAIRYHNKLDLPDELNQDDRLMCSIIRDADKIDNFRSFCETDFVSFHERTPESVQSSEITEGVMQCFRERRTIPHSIIQTDADFFLLPYALIFGLVFNCSPNLVKQQGYFENMLGFKFSRIDNKKKFQEIVEHIKTVF